MVDKDTVRVLVDWKCNLKCAYCCNEQERFRKNILPIASFDTIEWEKYKVVCISGGEPLLFFHRIDEICTLTFKRNPAIYRIIYSNGLLWEPLIAQPLADRGIHAANIGLHFPASFDRIIKNVTQSAQGTRISVRFHVWDKYQQEMQERYPNVNFRFWKLDHCDRDNEDRFVLTQ